MEQVSQQSEVAKQDKEVPPEALCPSALDSDLIEAELLVEEVSIDGMCGVY